MTPQPQPKSSIVTNLRNVHVGLREDLEVSRHVFRGEPCYIVRDPMTFASQRLPVAEYELFSAVHAGRTLGGIFDELVGRERLAPEDEERFFEFVVRLHRLGFLQLPVSDDKLLYRRYQLRERARRREKMLGFLFLRIPLWNPNSFLDRTKHVGRLIFSSWFFALWAVVVGLAGYVAFCRWNELVQPVHGVLVAHNLPLLWTTLIVLKVFHEMGHAYACKHFGGHVPEMGAYLILFTPCAYMDATAAWGFPRKRERVIVSLGGMYVESFLSAIALFVWAATESSWLNSLAYNVLFLASVVTVLFNINPLMRYDGYYILSDWLEIPNLRQRANQHVVNLLKRLFLGLPCQRVAGDSIPSRVAGCPSPRRLSIILTTFGIAATVYRIGLLIALASLLASRMFIVGAAIGGGYLAILLFSTVRRLMRYLWYAAEVQSVRARAFAVSVLVLLILPAGMVFIPVPGRVHAPGVLTTEHETVVRALASGFLDRVRVADGEDVTAGMILADLSNDESLEQIARARAGLRAAQLRRDAFAGSEPARARQHEIDAASRQAALTKALSDAAELRIPAPQSGRVINCLKDTDLGRFIPEGTPVVQLASGAWHVRVILTESQLVRAHAQVGDTAEFRAPGQAGRSFTGRIVRVAPAGSRAIEHLALTHLGGGEIAVDPTAGTAAQPYFEITLELQDSPYLRSGLTGALGLQAAAEPLAASLGRRLLRFWNRLLQG